MWKKVLVLTSCVLIAAPSFANDAPAAASNAMCSVTVEANDQLQFSTNEIDVPASCKTFTVTLKNTGFMPKEAMGHNIVIAPTDKYKEVDAEGAKAGPAHNYVPVDSPDVVAYTAIVGGGETTSTTFDVSKLKAGQDYTFFCSFPGHSAYMHGKVVLKP